MSCRWSSACLSGLASLVLASSGLTAGDNDPSDPNAPTPRIRYQSVLSGYTYQPPKGAPADWRELNERMERIGGPGGQMRDLDESKKDKSKP